MKKKRVTQKADKAVAPVRSHDLGYVLGIPAVILTFLLPLKFVSIAGIPEVAMQYPSSLVALIIVFWPINVFFLISGVLLLTTVFLLRKPVRVNHSSFFVGIWCVLAVFSLIGFINASTYVFPLMQVVHMLGVIAYAVSVYLLIQHFPGLKPWFVVAIVLGTFVSVLWGYEQFFFGMKETQDFVYQQELKSGIVSSGKFHHRLNDGRVFATFSLCNSFAAHLILTMPLCCWFVWHYAGKVEPPITSRLIFLPITIAAMVVMLYLTGSRAAVLGFGLACVGVLMLMSFPKKILIPMFVVAVIATAGGFWAVQRGRDLLSVDVRLDYYTVALKMFVRHWAVGSGWGDFFHDYMLLKKLPWDEAPHTPHNLVLAFASQTGVLGLLAAVAGLLYPFAVLVGWLRRRFKRRLEALELSKYVALFTDFRFAVLVGWTAWSVHGLADINLQVPGTLATALLMVMLALPKTSPSRHRQRKQIPYRVILPVTVLVAVVVIGGSWYMIRGEYHYGILQDYCDPRFKDPKEFMRHDMYGMQSRLKDCVRTMPYSPFPYTSAADFAAMKGFLMDSEMYLNKAIELSPERSSFYWKLGLYQLYMKKPFEADKNFRKAQSLFPKHPKYSKYPSKEAFIR